LREFATRPKGHKQRRVERPVMDWGPAADNRLVATVDRRDNRMEDRAEHRY
jgi:hypothetical protein